MENEDDIKKYRELRKKIMQQNNHPDTAVNPSARGEFELMLLKMFIKTRNSVTNNVIRPGTTSGSITKLA